MSTNPLTHLSDLKSFFLENLEEEQCNPKSAAEFFKKALSELSILSVIGQEECIARCLRGIQNTRQLVDCDLSQTSRELIETYLKDFNQAVDETLYLTMDESQNLKDAFRVALCSDVEEKWAGIMAGSFYPILLISSDEEKVIAIQKWTDQYFIGLDYLIKREHACFSILGSFVAKLQDQTSKAFRAHIFDRIQNKMEVMHARAEKDPLAFESKLGEIFAKKDENPALLSPEETEYVEFAQNAANFLTMYFPDVEKKMELLKKCIWHGFTLHEMKLSILDPGMSRRIFERLFEDAQFSV